MAKRKQKIYTKYVVNGKTTNDFGAFRPSNKYAIRGSLLASIEKQDADALNKILIEGYIYPSDKHKSCWLTDGRYAYYTETYERPVIEKWYMEEQVFFHELINKIIKQNNESLCEALLNALGHISVTDINLKKLYHFDKVAIGAAMESLKKYQTDPTDQIWHNSKLKSEYLKNLDTQLNSILNSYDNQRTINAEKSSIYPSDSELSESKNPKMSPIIQQVKAIKCKLDMYQCLHQYDAVLEKHRNPKLLRIIGEIVVALCTGFTFHLIHIPLTGRWSFFNGDTDSMGLVHDVDSALFKEGTQEKQLVRLTT